MLMLYKVNAQIQGGSSLVIFLATIRLIKFPREFDREKT